MIIIIIILLGQQSCTLRKPRRGINYLSWLLFRGFPFMAPPWGLSTPRAPKEPFQKLRKSNMVTKQVLFLRISTIFCMREAVTISNVSRILPCPLGLKNDLKTTIYFLIFFQKVFFCFFCLRALVFVFFWCHRGAILIHRIVHVLLGCSISVWIAHVLTVLFRWLLTYSTMLVYSTSIKGIGRKLCARAALANWTQKQMILHRLRI